MWGFDLKILRHQHSLKSLGRACQCGDLICTFHGISTALGVWGEHAHVEIWYAHFMA